VSSTISSTEVVTTTAVTYAWTGTANASPSIQRVNGAETRRNLITNPSFTTSLTGWTASAATTLTLESASAKLVSKGGRNFLSTPVAVVPGVTYTASTDVRLPAASGTTYKLLVEFYADLVNYSYVGETISTQSVQAATGFTRISHTFTVPAGVTGAFLYPVISTGSTPANETAYVDAVLFEIGSVSQAPFDGSTAASTGVRYATSNPQMVVGYDSARAGQNVFNSVLGRSNPDVTLLPAAPRTGTLTYLFTNEADAAECERMHQGTELLTLADSDLSTIGMTYVLDGNLRRQLDPETRSVWTVAVDFQEVIS
jgi:hypothetical protein